MLYIGACKGWLVYVQSADRENDPRAGTRKMLTFGKLILPVRNLSTTVELRIIQDDMSYNVSSVFSASWMMTTRYGERDFAASPTR